MPDDRSHNGWSFRLGAQLGPATRKGKWLWKSVFGTAAQERAAEAAVGHDLAAAMLAAIPRDPDVEVQRYLAELGARLAACVADEQARVFVVEVVLGDEVNAFALPGGWVFVTRPLLELVRGDADEIAFILAHEMGHIIRRHPLQRILADRTAAAALRRLPAGRALAPWLRKSGSKLLRSAYSRRLELQADRVGARLVRAAGFDPTASSALLRRLQQAEAPLLEYFSSHPPLAARIATLDELNRT